MRRMVVCLCAILGIFVPNANTLTGAYGLIVANVPDQANLSDQTNLLDQKKEEINPMEALDQVKERYAANFDRVFLDTRNEYYYKLKYADYYLVYEGVGETDNIYVYHLYEVVIDESETGLGHTVTYGWYKVNNESGEIMDQTQ